MDILSIHADFAREHGLVILVIPFEDIWCVEFIRAVSSALTAFDAVLDILHLRLPVRGKPGLRRSAAQHQRHSRAVADRDLGRTCRHAVTAAAAELAREFSLF